MQLVQGIKSGDLGGHGIVVYFELKLKIVRLLVDNNSTTPYLLDFFIICRKQEQNVLL